MLVILVFFISSIIAGPGCYKEDLLFPCSDLLEKKVNFWIKVYSEISTDRGILHNPETYEEYALINIKGLDRRARNRHIKTEKKKIAQAFGLKISDIRFQKGQMENFHKGIERSFMYLPYIKKILAENDIPEDLAYLPHVESSFNYKAYSKMGAAGIWQFTRGTGRQYMNLDYTIDERFDPIESTQAAARFLRSNYSKLKSWPVTITSYNHGLYGMRRAIKKTGTDNLITIIKKYKSRIFGFASKNFYSEFLAARHIAKNYEQFFPDIKRYEELLYSSVPIDFYTPLKVLLDNLELSIDEFKKYNPALRSSVFQGTRYIPKTYEIRVPPSHLSQLKLAINNIPKDKRYIKQRRPRWYKVRYGDNLSTIARTFRVSVASLKEMNNLNRRGWIRAGQILELPLEGISKKKNIIKKTVVGITKVLSKKEKPEEIQIAKAESRPSETIIKSNKSAVSITSETELKNNENPVNEEREENEEAEVDTLYGPPLPPDRLKAKYPEQLEEKLLVYGYKERMTKIDYGYILVQPEETMSHFADWLLAPKWKIKKWNGIRRNSVYINQRLKVYFINVSKEDFESKRIEYHKELYEDFFANYKVPSVEEHTLLRGESLWYLSNQVYQIPLWLLHMYNPQLNFSKLSKGDKIKIPIVESKVN